MYEPIKAGEIRISIESNLGVPYNAILLCAFWIIDLYN